MKLLIARSPSVIEKYFISKNINRGARAEYIPIFGVVDMGRVVESEVEDIILLDGYWQNPMYNHWMIKRLEENLCL